MVRAPPVTVPTGVPARRHPAAEVGQVEIGLAVAAISDAEDLGELHVVGAFTDWPMQSGAW